MTLWYLELLRAFHARTRLIKGAEIMDNIKITLEELQRLHLPLRLAPHQTATKFALTASPNLTQIKQFVPRSMFNVPALRVD